MEEKDKWPIIAWATSHNQGWMTGVILPISATEPRKPRRGFY
jgi:hypothetical protein